MDIISDNLLSQLNNQLSEPVVQFPLDGSFHHFKNGKKEPNSSHIWACGYSWEFKGNTYQYVTAGDWRDGSKITVRSYDTDKITKAERTNASEHIKRIEEETTRVKNQNHDDCKLKWETIFNDQLVEAPTHPYLIFKKSDSNYRGRVRNGNTLLIPIEHPEHGLVGCQQIFKDKDSEKYLKIFTKGIRIKGSYSRITNFDLAKTDLIYLCEGYATATSVFKAIKKPTICCFNAGNIIPAIVSIRAVNPNCKIIIAADNDHANPKNPGKYYANLASKQFSNVIYRLPSFDNGDGLSDFNDLHVCESIDKVSDQLNISSSDFVSIISLGHNSGSYYYVNTQTSEIFSLSSQQHVPSSFLAQATSKYWGQRFKFKCDKEGNPSSKPDWDIVAEDLFQEQRNTGFFNHENVRGYGAWLDSGQIIFNSGKNLHVYNSDNTVTSTPITEHNLNTQYIYEANKAIPFSSNSILTPSERDQIIQTFSLASYKNENDYIYLLGFIACAQIPGVTPWRPHHWLTGSRGTGKTTLLSWVSELCYDQGTIQDPSAAGLRQMIKSNALPTFIDEFEYSKNTKQVMELIRQSSSSNASKIIRGSADGVAQSYLVSSTFCLSSIQVSINNAADLSRITVIELTKNKRENFELMRKLASNFGELSPKLLSYMVSESQNYLKNIPVIHDFILDEYPSLDSRQADQISALVAGYYALKHGGLVDEFKISLIFSMLNINSSDYVLDNQETDESRCLDAILSSVDTFSSDRSSVASMVQRNEGSAISDLQNLGIKVLEKVPGKYTDIFIRSNSNPLKKIINDTEYHDYAKILRRSECLVKHTDVQKIFGRSVKGLIVRVALDAPDQKELCLEAPSEVPF